MRDLGLMGESTFNLWCADAGLIPNGSQIDKTGWDFFVEFPYDTDASPDEIHKAAFECKVQVKATDKNNRKLSITLSNLRRLITAQMPAFFVFIEFDGRELAQNAFIVHVDNDLISKVLKRLLQLEQSDKDNNFNKRTMTIYYDEVNRMDSLNGCCLKEILMGYMGDDMSEYVGNKKSHLESTGYENGFAQVSFTTVGEDNLKKLIDVSIGVEEMVDISHLKATQIRFGIASKPLFDESEKAQLGMPGLKPSADGIVRFKEDKLEVGISFPSRLYVSPLNIMVPEEFKKMRIEGEFFDMQINPYIGSANYSFSFGEGVDLEVSRFRDALKLLGLLSSKNKSLQVELVFTGFPKLEFEVTGNDVGFDFLKELKALECAVNLISYFGLSNQVSVTFDEISKYEKEICQMDTLVHASSKLFNIEFGVNGDDFDIGRKVACIFLTNVPIGDHVLGVIFVAIGRAEEIKNERFKLDAEDVIVEKKIVTKRGEAIDSGDLISAVKFVEDKYDKGYSAVNFFDTTQHGKA